MPSETVDQRDAFLFRQRDLVVVDHLGDGSADNLLEHGFRTAFADGCFFEREHDLFLSGFDCGEPVARPCHRFGEKVGSKRGGEKCRRTKFAKFFRPAAPEVEISVSAAEVKIPFSARVTAPVRRTM